MKQVFLGLVLLIGLGASAGLFAQAATAAQPEEELVPFRQKNKWGFADAAGTLQLKPQYDTVAFFRAGLAVAGRNGRLGLLDSRGEWVVPRRYAAIRYDPRYRRYWLRERKSDEWYVRLPDGKLLPPAELGQEVAELDQWRRQPVFPPPHRGYRLERSGGGFVLHEPDGNTRPLAGAYDTLLIARPFRLYFRSNGLWGVMSYRGEVLFPAQFTALEPALTFTIPRDDGDVYAARREDRWGLISWEQGTLLPFRYSAVERLAHPQHQLFRLTEGGRQGFFDLTTGKLVEPRYRQVSPFDARGLAQVITLRGRSGYINWSGTEYFVD
jgi:hypothetical protein